MNWKTFNVCNKLPDDCANVIYLKTASVVINVVALYVYKADKDDVGYTCPRAQRSQMTQPQCSNRSLYPESNENINICQNTKHPPTDSFNKIK